MPQASTAYPAAAFGAASAADALDALGFDVVVSLQQLPEARELEGVPIVLGAHAPELEYASEFAQSGAAVVILTADAAVEAAGCVVLRAPADVDGLLGALGYDLAGGELGARSIGPDPAPAPAPARRALPGAGTARRALPTAPVAAAAVADGEPPTARPATTGSDRVPALAARRRIPPLPEPEPDADFDSAIGLVPVPFHDTGDASDTGGDRRASAGLFDAAAAARPVRASGGHHHGAHHYAADVVVVFAGRGGASKTSTTLTLAAGAAAGGVGRVLVVDGNRGQGGIRSILRIDDAAPVPSIHSLAYSGTSATSVVLSAEQITQLRGPRLPPVRFSAVLAPPGEQGNAVEAPASLYRRLLAEVREQFDLIIVDTQTLDSEGSDLFDVAWTPALLAGGWGLGLTEQSSEGVEMLEKTLDTLRGAGVSSGRLLLVAALWSAGEFTAELAEVFRTNFAGRGTFVGATVRDPAVSAALSVGVVEPDADAVRPVIRRVLSAVTGSDRFDDPGGGRRAQPQRRKRGLLGVLFGGR